MKEENNNIILSVGEANEVSRLLVRLYSDNSLNLNNELASNIKQLTLNIKSRGILGTTGTSYFNNNRIRFEKIIKLIELRQMIKDTHKTVSKENIPGAWN